MFGNFLYYDSLPGVVLCPKLFCLSCYLLHFVLPPFEDKGCFSGSLMSSANNQKLFCAVCSVFKCSFDEFVGEKLVSPSYSSAILAPPLSLVAFTLLLLIFSLCA